MVMTNGAGGRDNNNDVRRNRREKNWATFFWYYITTQQAISLIYELGRWIVDSAFFLFYSLSVFCLLLCILYMSVCLYQ